MADSERDNNRVVTMVGVSSSDGTTIVPVKIDSVSGKVMMKAMASGAHGAVTNREIAYRDANRVPVMLGESSADDGVLVMPVVESGNLRIKDV